LKELHDKVRVSLEKYALIVRTAGNRANQNKSKYGNGFQKNEG